MPTGCARSGSATGKAKEMAAEAAIVDMVDSIWKRGWAAFSIPHQPVQSNPESPPYVRLVLACNHGCFRAAQRAALVQAISNRPAQRAYLVQDDNEPKADQHDIGQHNVGQYVDQEEHDDSLLDDFVRKVSFAESNASVDAVSCHSTSVNFCLATDSVAQASQLRYGKRAN